MAKNKEIRRIIKFFLFSASAGIIEIASFTILNEIMNWPYWPCYLIALTLSVLWNFTFNRKFTFQSIANVPNALFKVFCFYLVFTPVTTIGGNYLVETLGWNEYIVTAMNMGLNLVTEYLYDRFIVYRGTIDTNKRAQKERTKELAKEGESK